MLGLLAGLIIGAGYVGSSINQASQTRYFKQHPHSLPNGVLYYSHADGSTRLMDGRKIMWTDYGESETVKTMEGEVIYDAKREMNKKIASCIDPNQKYKYAVQYNCRIKTPVITNIETCEKIAQIGIENGENGEYIYKKWKLYDYVAEEIEQRTGRWCGSEALRVEATSVRSGDPGIIISKEEFDAILLARRFETGSFKNLVFLSVLIGERKETFISEGFIKRIAKKTEDRSLF